VPQALGQHRPGDPGGLRSGSLKRSTPRSISLTSSRHQRSPRISTDLAGRSSSCPSPQVTDAVHVLADRRPRRLPEFLADRAALFG
jgi:hypothetical protein